jgi:hypothetical protein
MRMVHFMFYSCIIEQVVNGIHFGSGWRGQGIEDEAEIVSRSTICNSVERRIIISISELEATSNLVESEDTKGTNLQSLNWAATRTHYKTRTISSNLQDHRIYAKNRKLSPDWLPQDRKR